MNIKHLALKDMESGQLQGPHNVSLLKQLGKGKGRNHTQHSFKGQIYLISNHVVKHRREQAGPDQKGRAGAIITAQGLSSLLFSQVPPWQQQERKTEALIKHKTKRVLPLQHCKEICNSLL